MTSYRILSFLTLLSFSTTNAQTAGDIISKHLAAIGGKENIKNIKSLSIKGTITSTNVLAGLTIANGNMVPKDNIVQSNSSYTETTLNGKAYLLETSFQSGNSGKCFTDNRGKISGWSFLNMNGEAEMGPMDEARYNAGKYLINIEGRLVSYPGNGIRMTLLNKFNGVYTIQAESENYNAKYSFDASTFYVNKIEEVIAVMQYGFDLNTKTIEVSEYSDYQRTPSGYVVAHSIVRTTELGGKPTATKKYTINKVEVNKDIDPKIFDYDYMQAKIKHTKDKEIEEAANKQAAAERTNKENQNLANEKASLAFIGKIDESLDGSWRHFAKAITTYLIFKLNKDGTFQYYVRKIIPGNLEKNGLWKIHIDTLVLFYKASNGNSILEKYKFHKLNNASTGKPSIVLAWMDANDIREFKTVEDKKPWSDMPAFGDKMVPTESNDTKLEGSIDKEIVGVWKAEYKISRREDVYKFNVDGTGELTESDLTTARTKITKFEWRINNNVLWKRTDCGEGEKCIQNNEHLEKITVVGNKPALRIRGSYIYIRQ